MLSRRQVSSRPQFEFVTTPVLILDSESRRTAKHLGENDALMGSPKLKVLYLASTLERSGPTRQLLNIVRHLDSEYFDAMVVTLSPGPAHSMWKEFEAAGIHVECLNLSRRRTFSAGRRLQYLAGKFGADIVHSHGIRSDVLSAMYLSSAFRVATARNLARREYTIAYGELAGWRPASVRDASNAVCYACETAGKAGTCRREKC